MQDSEFILQLKREKKELEKKLEVLNIDLVKYQIKEELKEIEEDYIEIVCCSCKGTGIVYSGGFDDPFEKEDCDLCEGRGFLLARKFNSIKKEYDLKFNEI